MNVPCLETKRLILRSFEEGDLRAFYFLLKDEEVNTFLPGFRSKTWRRQSCFMKSDFPFMETEAPFIATRFA